jgi:hypothetical protein
MRIKIWMSVPAVLSTAVFVFGLFGILLYSFVVDSRNKFLISIGVGTLSMYLVSLVLACFLVFMFLRRRRD